MTFSLTRLARRVALLAFALAPILITSARADIRVDIDKSSQHMSVRVDGAQRYSWPVSTGRSGYGTPSGTFHPQAMMRSYFSRKYYNAPMPHAIFSSTATCTGMSYRRASDVTWRSMPIGPQA